MPLNDDPNICPEAVLIGGPCDGRRVEGNRNCEKIFVNHTDDGWTYRQVEYNQRQFNISGRYIFIWVYVYMDTIEAMIKLFDSYPVENVVRLPVEISRSVL